MTVATDLGRFVWYELLTPDPSAAQKFYKEIVGWDTAPFQGGSPDMPPYTMWMNGEAPVGGVMELPAEAKAQGAPPHWVAYVDVPDVRETTKRAKELGATVLLEPMDIPDVGSVALFKDPQGAVIGIHTPATPVPAKEGAPGVGEFSWHELATTDHVAAFNFYHDIFAWEKQSEMDMGPDGIYQMYGRNGQMLGGMYNKPAAMPAPPHWLLYTRVPDINKAVERVKALGGQVLNGPMEVPGGDFVVQCLDPQGAAFALHSST
jgi:predicted enzyme related to lactoylglutathione lyase